ncbi:hypothetical protein VTN77DRAFT_6955 [Rasamsonia byssochlamydoides]|uniref:uncharacterized protein n=1 Tax=Rasamsonia byssochlamydoides TaxID=89139 RepID=UPI00374209D8
MLKKRKLPKTLETHNIIQQIYQFLDRDENVFNFNEAVGIGPRGSRLMELAHKYFAPNKPDVDISYNVRTILRNVLQHPADRYPFTSNYRTVWYNVQLVVAAMETTKIPLHEDVPYTAKLRGSTGIGRFAIPIRNCSNLSFMFNEVRGLKVLSGIVIDGELVGYEGQWWSPVCVTSMKGLRVASIADQFVAVQVRDMTGWHARWHGTYPGQSSIFQLE